MSNLQTAYLRSETIRITAQINGLKDALAEKRDFVPLAERAIQGDESAQLALIALHEKKLFEIEKLLLSVIEKAASLGIHQVVEFDPKQQKCTAERRPLDLEVRLYRTHAKYRPSSEGTVAIHEDRRGTTVRHIVQLKPLFI